MTSETKTFINATDIAGIEVECQQCHVTIFYPVSAMEERAQIIARCPHCNGDLFDAAPAPAPHFAHFPSYPAVDDLHKIASGLRALTSI
jgi:hypothetical protein